MSETTTRPLLDVRQAAALLSVSTRTVYTLVAKGQLPYARVGGSLRFVPEVLEQWLRDGGETTA